MDSILIFLREWVRLLHILLLCSWFYLEMAFSFTLANIYSRFRVLGEFYFILEFYSSHYFLFLCIVCVEKSADIFTFYSLQGKCPFSCSFEEFLSMLLSSLNIIYIDVCLFVCFAFLLGCVVCTTWCSVIQNLWFRICYKFWKVTFFFKYLFCPIFSLLSETNVPINIYPTVFRCFVIFIFLFASQFVLLLWTYLQVH